MAYDVTLERLPVQAVFDLKGKAAALASWCGAALPPLPARPNSFVARDGKMLHWIGPDHWILRADLSMEDRLLAALRPEAAPADLSVVLISDTLAFFTVTGPEADQVMAVATPLDRAGLGPDAAVLTEALGLKALIRRIPGGYELAVDQSYGTMTAEYFDRIAS